MLGKTVPKETYDELFGKYTALVFEMMEMKREGFVAQPRHPELEQPDLYEVPEKVMDAIHARFRPGSPEAAAQQEIAYGMLHREPDAVEEVVSAVLAGEDIGL